MPHSDSNRDAKLSLKETGGPSALEWKDEVNIKATQVIGPHIKHLSITGFIGAPKQEETGVREAQKPAYHRGMGTHDQGVTGVMRAHKTAENGLTEVHNLGDTRMMGDHNQTDHDALAFSKPADNEGKGAQHLADHAGKGVHSLADHGGKGAHSLADHGGKGVHSLADHGGKGAHSLTDHGGKGVRLTDHGGKGAHSLTDHAGKGVHSLTHHGGKGVHNLAVHGEMEDHNLADHEGMGAHEQGDNIVIAAHNEGESESQHQSDSRASDQGGGAAPRMHHHSNVAVPLRDRHNDQLFVQPSAQTIRTADQMDPATWAWLNVPWFTQLEDSSTFDENIAEDRVASDQQEQRSDKQLMMADRRKVENLQTSDESSNLR